jgi:N,N'-diacetylchitobiose transport system permease protein
MTDLTSSQRVLARRRRKPGEKPLATGLWNTLAVAFGIVMGFPIYWMFISTIESGKDLLSFTPHFFPTSFSFSDYTQVFQDPDFFQDMLNTAIITISTVLIGLLIGFLGAVSVARFKFRGRNIFIVAMMFVQMVPLLTIAIPLYFVLNDLKLLDQLLGVILIYLVFTVPYAIWVLRSFIVNIPVELDEAAMVDGCRCPAWSRSACTPGSRRGTSS